MDKEFWFHRWNNNRIAFHDSRVNRLLAMHLDALSLEKGSRVFLPLCGKTLDIGWLLSQGYRVSGVELSALAVQQLFSELGVTPEITRANDLERYHAANIDIFAGDVFELTAELLGPADAVYDRAAFVALPHSMRGRYARHVAEITGTAPQLLICFEYDQELMEGPPFSIGEEEVARQYGSLYDPALLDRVELPGGLKGVEARETAWLLNRN